VFYRPLKNACRWVDARASAFPSRRSGGPRGSAPRTPATGPSKDCMPRNPASFVLTYSAYRSGMCCRTSYCEGALVSCKCRDERKHVTSTTREIVSSQSKKMTSQASQTSTHLHTALVCGTNVEVRFRWWRDRSYSSELILDGGLRQATPLYQRVEASCPSLMRSGED